MSNFNKGGSTLSINIIITHSSQARQFLKQGDLPRIFASQRVLCLSFPQVKARGDSSRLDTLRPNGLLFNQMVKYSGGNRADEINVGSGNENESVTGRSPDG